jgi:hypothetical protein
MMTSQRFSPVLILLTVALAAGPAQALDFPVVDGWKPAGEATAKSPDTLWEYNDGAAEAFLAYGFQGLRYADLSSGDLVVTVEIYDMGTPINAFGIYTTECSSDAEQLNIGTEASLALPYQCLLLKDRNYIKLNLYQGELSKEKAEGLLRALAKALPGTNDWPAELGLLPEKGRVPGSVGYTREAYLGMSALTECVHAKYQGGEKPFQRFVMLTGSEKDRQSAWDKLAATWTAAELKGKPVLWREIPYLGITGTMLTDQGIFGVAGCADEKQLMERLGVFLD